KTDQIHLILHRFDGPVPFVGWAIHHVPLIPFSRGSSPGAVGIQIIWKEIGVQTVPYPGEPARSIGSGVLWKAFAVVVGIHYDRITPSFQIATADNADRFLFGSAQRGQEERRQNGDNSDD